MRLLTGPAVTPEEFADRLDPLTAGVEGTLAVAVSGGPDSLALFDLADRWARARSRDLMAFTVDHGLRPEAAAEAARVAALAASRGRRHATMSWTGEKPASGLQAAARDARYRLLLDACRGEGIGALLLGHHLDDQAETILHRIDRDSGPDGLAGMARLRAVGGVRLLRPLLDVPKDRLLATCRMSGLEWADDPSNRDVRFARTGLRALAPVLAELDVTAQRLGRLGDAMAVTRAALDRFAADWMARHAEIRSTGQIRLDRVALVAAPPVLRRRLVERSLRAVGGAGYPVRGDRLDRLMAWIGGTEPAARSRTLGGCRVASDAGWLTVIRDWRQSDRPVIVGPRGRVLWDGRFEIENPTAAPVRVGACGDEGWRRWRRTVAGRAITRSDGESWVPHAARLALPAVVDLDGGIALPHLVPSAPAPSGWVGDTVKVRFRPIVPFP